MKTKKTTVEINFDKIIEKCFHKYGIDELHELFFYELGISDMVVFIDSSPISFRGGNLKFQIKYEIIEEEE